MFMSITKKKYKLIKMDKNTYYELMFILLNIFQMQKLTKKHAGRDLIFEDKRQEALKKLGCEFIRINKIKCYDGNYEIGRIQTFISEL